MTAAPGPQQPDEVKRSLSPTQELVMDVLAARLRLGDRLWTFTTKVRPTVRKLAELGLVTEMHGITDHTVRASLTDAGRELWMLPGYTPAAPSAQPDEVRSIRDVVHEFQEDINDSSMCMCGVPALAHHVVMDRLAARPAQPVRDTEEGRR